MLGQRHPAALGKPAAVIWSEIWDTIGPQTDAVLYEGRATWNEERLLVLERNGYPEEAYFTFSYSPVPADDGGVGGIFCALTEDTQRVLGQRRLRTLRELSARTTGARTVEQACQAATDTLAQNPHDLPFALIYLLDGEGKVARLAGTTGLADGSPACPPSIDLTSSDGRPACWPLRPGCGHGPGRVGGGAGGPLRSPALRRLAGPAAVGHRPARHAVRPGPPGRVPGRRDQPPAGLRRRLPGLHRPAGRAHRHRRRQRPGLRGGAAAGRGAGRTRPGQDRLLLATSATSSARR